MSNKRSDQMIEEIALECERHVKLWPTFEERVKIARAELDMLCNESGIQTEAGAAKVSEYELRRRVRQALGIDELEVENSTCGPARSYAGARKRREKSKKNASEKLGEYGCEEDEGMRHKKTAWKLRNPVSLTHQDVVRDSDGRFVPFEWRRRWWDDEDPSSNNSAQDE